MPTTTIYYFRMDTKASAISENEWAYLLNKYFDLYIMVPR